MTLNQQKEHLSAAYVYAVASAAGCSVKITTVDDDSVDLTVVSKIAGNKLHAPELNIQLKATAQDVLNDSEVVFPLKLKNYDDLRKKTLVPRILVVMVVPEHPDAWLKQAEAEAQIFHCAYWMSLWNAPERQNLTSVSVKLPRSNIFTPETLSRLMYTIANGGRP